jgi:hypothetical protein
MPILTTLNKIRANNPCEYGWQKLLKHLDKTKADDAPLAFSTILESNGLNDSLWCLCSVSPEHDKEIRLLAAEYADQGARDFANVLIDDNGRDDAWDAAWAAMDAAMAAGAAERKIQEELLIKYFG